MNRITPSYFGYFQEKPLGDHIINLGITLTKPFWHAEELLSRAYLPLKPGKFGQRENRATEIFFRILFHLYGIPLAISSLPIAIAGHCLLSLGQSLGSSPFQYTKGSIAETCIHNPKILHLNACMMPGSLPLHFGGLTPASFRIPALRKLIETHEPDILLLSEIGDVISYEVEQNLDDLYANFYSKMGLKPFGMSSNLWVASKVSCLDSVFNVFTQQGKGAQRAVKRGYFKMEFPDKSLYFTHLHPGSSPLDQEIRKKQLTQIQKEIESSEKSAYLIGDLNIDEPNFFKEYNLHWIDPANAEEKESCTDNLSNHLKGLPEKQGQLLDYALYHGHISNYRVSYLNTYLTLSDHKALLIYPV